MAGAVVCVDEERKEGGLVRGEGKSRRRVGDDDVLDVMILGVFFFCS